MFKTVVCVVWLDQKRLVLSSDLDCLLNRFAGDYGCLHAKIEHFCVVALVGCRKPVSPELSGIVGLGDVNEVLTRWGFAIWAAHFEMGQKVAECFGQHLVGEKHMRV